MKKSYRKLLMAAGAVLATFALGACGAADDAQADLSQAAQTAAEATTGQMHLLLQGRVLQSRTDWKPSRNLES